MTDKFGWKDDGIRGYVFTDEKQDIVVITFKGTSTSLFGVGGGQTSAHDKHNDNMMFSCCCASVDGTWIPLCDVKYGDLYFYN
jgi:lipase ATG15